MRRLLAAAAAVCALVALPACGDKTDERARAAGITPPNALAFATISLDPAIEQKRHLLSIARAFPKAKVKGEFEEARDELLEQLLEDSGLDYRTDVKPWLGNEVAVAALPAAQPGGSPVAVVFIAATDKDKAEAALAKADKTGAPSQHRFIDDFAVIVSDRDAAGRAALDAVAAQADKKDTGLAEAANFTEPVGELHGDRLLLGWVDSQRALEAAKGAAGDALPPQLGFADQFKNAKPVAFDLHAADKALVLEAATKTSIESKGGQPRLAESLPAATLAVLTAFDIGGSLERSLAQVGGEGDPAATFKDTFGLDLRSDVLAWMHGEVSVALAPPPAGEEIPNLALVIEPTDHAAAAAAMPRIRQALLDQLRNADQPGFTQQTIAGVQADVMAEPLQGTVQPAMALFADRFVIASRPAYLAEVAATAPSKLGDSAPYKSVVDLGSSGKTLFQLLVRVDPIRELLEQIFGVADDKRYQEDVRPNLVPLDVLGARAYKLGEFDRFELKLTVS